MVSKKVRILLQDVFIIAASICIAVLLVKTQAIKHLILSTQNSELIGSFISGLFFTSVFTTAPAIVALGEIAKLSPILVVAFFGAIGAVLGDLLIFSFIRDRFSEHVMQLLEHKREKVKPKPSHYLKFFRWFTFLLGGLIIASPLPDELGISLMGFSHISTRLFIPVSFIFNFIGIILIGLVANSL